MPGCRLLLLSLFMVMAFPLGAHTIPTLKVEAEFTRGREVTLYVNLDARLFLAPDPTTLPPVPPSWWTEQSEEARAKTAADAKAYVARTLFFTVGSAKLEPPWKVIAVDGGTLAPLTPDSEEIHLLCEYQGKLPAVPGGFQMNVGSRCAVGVVLLNRMEGDPEPGLQALFPGEPSRRFPLPEPGSQAAVPVSKTKPVSREAPKPALGLFAWSAGQISRMDCGVLLIFATALLRGRFLTALSLLLAFHVGESAIVLAMQSGSLAGVQRWTSSLGWLFLVLAAVTAVIGVVSPRKRWRLPLAAVFLGGTGACWEIPPESMAWLLWQQAAVLAWQAAFLTVLYFGCWVLQKARETPSLGSQGTLIADSESRRDEGE